MEKHRATTSSLLHLVDVAAFLLEPLIVAEQHREVMSLNMVGCVLLLVMRGRMHVLQFWACVWVVGG